MSHAEVYMQPIKLSYQDDEMCILYCTLLYIYLSCHIHDKLIYTLCILQYNYTEHVTHTVGIEG